MPMSRPSEEEEKTKAQLVKKYLKILNKADVTEMSIKPFLDANPSFIPTPWMLNHQLHFGIILPQFSLSVGLKTDCAYLTKSSTSWWCVLVEFESPTSRFFTNSNGVGIHSDLTRGLNQIDAWRDYLRNHKDSFLAELDPIRQPLNKNPVEFRYILVMGRRSEFENSNGRKISRREGFDVRCSCVRIRVQSAQPSSYNEEKGDQVRFREI
jgi:hypothetical protein